MFADADGASKFSHLTLLQTAMDGILTPSSPLSNESTEQSTTAKEMNGNADVKVVGHGRRKSMDMLFGKKVDKRALRGQGVVVGSRAHLEKSEAVVKVSKHMLITLILPNHAVFYLLI